MTALEVEMAFLPILDAVIGFAESSLDQEVFLCRYRPVPIGLPPSSLPVLKLEVLIKETVLEFLSLSITFSLGTLDTCSFSAAL